MIWLILRLSSQTLTLSFNLNDFIAKLISGLTNLMPLLFPDLALKALPIAFGHYLRDLDSLGISSAQHLYYIVRFNWTWFSISVSIVNSDDAMHLSIALRQGWFLSKR